MRVEPGEVSGLPGDEIEVTIHFFPHGEGLGEPTFSRPRGWFRARPEHVRLRPWGKKSLGLTRPEIFAHSTATGFVLRGSVLVPPTATQVTFPVLFTNRQKPGSTTGADVQGPVVEVESIDPQPRIVVDWIANPALDRSLDVRAKGRTLIAILDAERPPVLDDPRIEFFCASGRTPHVWTLRRIGGRTALVGFTQYPSFHCCDIVLVKDYRPRSPRVRVAVPGPGPVDVVIYEDRPDGLIRTAAAVLME